MVKVEEKILESDIESLEESLCILFLFKDLDDDKNVIIEIKGVVGGDEGNIFVGDLFKMYFKYVENMGWKVIFVNIILGFSGGFVGIEFIILGENVFSYLKYELGVYCV